MYREAAATNQHGVTHIDMLDTKLTRTQKYKKTIRELISEQGFHSYS